MKKISNYTMIVSALVFFACTSQEEKRYIDKIPRRQWNTIR